MWKGLLNLLHNWVYLNYFVQHICWILILKFYGQILKFTNSWNCPCMPILKFVKLLTRQYNWFAIKSAIKDLLHSPSWEDKRKRPKQQIIRPGGKKKNIILITNTYRFELSRFVYNRWRYNWRGVHLAVSTKTWQHSQLFKKCAQCREENFVWIINVDWRRWPC